MIAARLPDHRGTVKRELVDVHAVVTALGLERGAKRQRNGFHICCPSHDERSASCSVRLADDGTIAVRCFACDFSGDVFSLIAQVRGLDVKRDFRKVLRIGAELAGLWSIVDELDKVHGKPAASSRPKPLPKLETPPSPVERPALSADVFDTIASALLESCPLTAQDDVCSYLEGRKLFDLAHSAGWSALPPPTKQAHVLARLVDMFGEETIARSGLVKRDRFVWSDHRLVIPWRAHGVDGIVTSLQRRLVRAPRDKEEPKIVFPGKPTPRPNMPYVVVDDFEENAGDDIVAYVEGAIDVLALRWCARQENRDMLVVGIPGAAAWRPEWAALARGRIAILALDADRAGDEAIAGIRRDLHAAKAIDRWRPKAHKDWADYVTEARK